jgi:diguanylate cyclase (GGDEF)-like protein
VATLRAAWRHRAGSWPLWALKPRLRAYVLTVIAAGAAATGWAAAVTHWHLKDLVLYVLLSAFGLITVEGFRRSGEPAGSIKDAHGLWELAIALVLPPFFALTAPVLWLALTQWRIRRTLAYRRVFSAAAIGMSYGAASLAFHSGWRLAGHPRLGPFSAGLVVWALLAAGCAALRWVLNNSLVLAAIRLDNPTARIADLLGGRDSLTNDASELLLGVLIAFCAVTGPLILVFALPCGVLLQRSARHSQLVHASRTDTKTGLLSAGAWQQEASVQVTRALRTRTPLAVAMVDIDHFKRVNDTYGHLAGDAVLAAVAAALTGGMREYDLPGRFGGEEFTILLPHADAAEAARIAERLRQILAQIPIPGSGAPGENPSCITASVGVAVLAPGMTDLTDLLAAADAAMYLAKQAGRNTVRLAGEPPSGEGLDYLD